MTSFPIGVVSNAQPWTGAASASISYTATSTNTNNRSDYTFTNLNIGTADASRIVAVTVYSSFGLTAQSVTIGGISATKVAGASGNVVDIWQAAVPTGTTATVFVQLSGSAGRCSVSVYRIIPGVSSTAYSSDAVNASTATQTEITGGVSVFIAVRDNSTTAYTVSRNGSALSTDQSSAYSGSNLVKIGNVSVSGSTNFAASATYSADFNAGYITIAHWR